LKKYDLIIVGAGPSAIFAALELVQNNWERILIVEKGQDIDKRYCPVRDGKPCPRCKVCAMLSGWGGAGAFSDGKLTLSPEVGGFLNRYISESKIRELIQYVDNIYQSFGATSELHGTNEGEIQKIQDQAARCDLKLISMPVRHLGTDHCGQILQNIKTLLNKKVDLAMNTEVQKILVRQGRVTGVETDKGEFAGDFVILAPGREGADWLGREVKRLQLSSSINPVDVGVRVEVPAPVMEHLTKVTYESKFIFHSKRFDDRVRTFCMNPYGEVVKEYFDGLFTVNGHSFKDRKTPYTNFAILVSTTFTEPFKEPVAYGKYIARLANILGEGVIVQRLGDLLAGRRSTPERIAKGIIKPTLEDATPGDLSFVLPYRYLADILEMLEALDKIAPGVNSRHTLIYGVEVKFYSLQLKLTSGMETEVKNLFAVGDGAGVSRGLIQASASGVVAAREILARCSPKKTS
jgi:hypothetical protein